MVNPAKIHFLIKLFIVNKGRHFQKVLFGAPETKVMVKKSPQKGDSIYCRMLVPNLKTIVQELRPQDLCGKTRFGWLTYEHFEIGSFILKNLSKRVFGIRILPQCSSLNSSLFLCVMSIKKQLSATKSKLLNIRTNTVF